MTAFNDRRILQALRSELSQFRPHRVCTIDSTTTRRLTLQGTSHLVCTPTSDDSKVPLCGYGLGAERRSGETMKPLSSGLTFLSRLHRFLPPLPRSRRISLRVLATHISATRSPSPCSSRPIHNDEIRCNVGPTKAGAAYTVLIRNEDSQVVTSDAGQVSDDTGKGTFSMTAVDPDDARPSTRSLWNTRCHPTRIRLVSTLPSRTLIQPIPDGNSDDDADSQESFEDSVMFSDGSRYSHIDLGID